MNVSGTPIVFYHYTTQQCLEQIKNEGMLRPCLPPMPSSPISHIIDGVDIKDKKTIFLTRMDPNNPKESIAFNNYR